MPFSVWKRCCFFASSRETCSPDSIVIIIPIVNDVVSSCLFSKIWSQKLKINSRETWLCCFDGTNKRSEFLVEKTRAQQICTNVSHFDTVFNIVVSCILRESDGVFLSWEFLKVKVVSLMSEVSCAWETDSWERKVISVLSLIIRQLSKMIPFSPSDETNFPSGLLIAKWIKRRRHHPWIDPFTPPFDTLLLSTKKFLQGSRAKQNNDDDDGLRDNLISEFCT